MTNPTMKKFGHPDTLIRDYMDWAVLLRNDQITLGSLVVVEKSPARSLSAVGPYALAELASIAGDIDHALVVESEWRDVVETPPGRAPGGALGQSDASRVHEGEPGDADAAVVGCRIEVSEGVELFEEDIGDAGLFGQLADGGLIEGLAVLERAAGDCPMTLGGRCGALNQEHLERAVDDGEDDDQHGDRRSARCGGRCFGC